MSAAAGSGSMKRATNQNGKPPIGSVPSINRRATEVSGNHDVWGDVPDKVRETLGLTNSKLSDRPPATQELKPTTRDPHRHVPVRWSAWLGTAPTERPRRRTERPTRPGE